MRTHPSLPLAWLRRGTSDPNPRVGRLLCYLPARETCLAVPGKALGTRCKALTARPPSPAAAGAKQTAAQPAGLKELLPPALSPERGQICSSQICGSPPGDGSQRAELRAPSASRAPWRGTDPARSLLRAAGDHRSLLGTFLLLSFPQPQPGRPPCPSPNPQCQPVVSCKHP